MSVKTYVVLFCLIVAGVLFVIEKVDAAIYTQWDYKSTEANDSCYNPHIDVMFQAQNEQSPTYLTLMVNDPDIYGYELAAYLQITRCGNGSTSANCVAFGSEQITRGDYYSGTGVIYPITTVDYGNGKYLQAFDLMPYASGGNATTTGWNRMTLSLNSPNVSNWKDVHVFGCDDDCDADLYELWGAGCNLTDPAFILSGIYEYEGVDFNIEVPFDGQYFSTTTTSTLTIPVEGSCPVSGGNRISLVATTTADAYERLTNFIEYEDTFNVSCSGNLTFESTLSVPTSTTPQGWYIIGADSGFWENPDSELYDEAYFYTGRELNAFEMCDSVWDEGVFIGALKSAFCWLFVGDYESRWNSFDTQVESDMETKYPFRIFTDVIDAWEGTSTTTTTTITVDLSQFDFASSTPIGGWSFTLYDFSTPWTDDMWVAFNWVENTLVPIFAVFFVLNGAVNIYKNLTG